LTCNGSFRMAAVIALLVLSGIASAKTRQPRPVKAQVRFLATSQSIRGTWGANEDVYLAEIAVSVGDKTLVRLIDKYPNLRSPLSTDSLTSTSGTILLLRRDTQCDMPFGKIQLRTAPGDRMAILPVKLKYQPQLLKNPEPNEILPCYRTVRPQ